MVQVDKLGNRRRRVGEIIEVKCLDVTESGRISLSRRALLPRND